MIVLKEVLGLLDISQSTIPPSLFILIGVVGRAAGVGFG
jgi:hypothetical protein